MRRLLSFLLILVLPATALLAQKFNGGVYLGGDVSQVDGDDNEGYHKVGYLAGGFVSLRVSPHSSFQMEIGYIQKGSRIGDTTSNSSNTYLMRFHYLEVPLLYQYTFAKRFSAEAGPAMDILLGSLEESNGIETQSTIPLRPVTLCGIIGVAGFITDHLKLSFRFNYSLLSIRDLSGHTAPASYRYILFEKGQFNNVLSLSLMYYFRNRDFGF
jgi:hypothetical protein